MLKNTASGAADPQTLLLLTECIDAASTTLIGWNRAPTDQSFIHQTCVLGAMFDVYTNSDDGGMSADDSSIGAISFSSSSASRLSLYKVISSFPLQIVFPNGVRMRNNFVSGPNQVSGQPPLLPLLAFDYIPLSRCGLRSVPPNLWRGLMRLLGVSASETEDEARRAEGSKWSANRSMRLPRTKSKLNKRSFRRVVSASQLQLGPASVAGFSEDAKSTKVSSVHRAEVMPKLNSRGSPDYSREGEDLASGIVEVRAVSPESSPSATTPMIRNDAMNDDALVVGDDENEVAAAFCELLEATERIQRKQMSIEYLRILASIHDHIRWHMAVLYLMENTRVEMVPVVGESRRDRAIAAGGGVGDGGGYALRKVGDWWARSSHGGFSRSLVIKTLTGIHPIFSEGGVLPSLRPMWVLQKGFALLQEEYASRCAIIVEYEHTPLLTLSQIKAAGAENTAEFKGFSKFANTRGGVNAKERSASVFEPRRPSQAAPKSGGGGSPFKGRRTSVIVAETGERRVSLVGGGGLGDSPRPNHNRRDTTIRGESGGTDGAPLPSTPLAKRRQSVASNGTAATEISSSTHRGREQTPSLPHIPSDRIYRPGVSAMRPYVDERKREGPLSPLREAEGFHLRSASSSSAQAQSDNEEEDSTVDPFEAFGSEKFGASSSGHVSPPVGGLPPQLLGGTIRRRSTLEEKNDEYQRRISLMSEVGIPAHRRGTLQYTEEGRVVEGQGAVVADKKRRRTTMRISSESDGDDWPKARGSTPDRPRFSLSGNHHPFASILHQQVSGATESPREAGMSAHGSDSGASTPMSFHSRNASLGAHEGALRGGDGRGGSVNSLLFASESKLLQQPLASIGGGLSPSSFYAPASANVVIPSARSRRMTTAEAELLFPARSPSISATFMAEPTSSNTAPLPPSILKSPTDRQPPSHPSSPPRKVTNPLRTSSSSEVSLPPHRSSANGAGGEEGSPRGSGLNDNRSSINTNGSSAVARTSSRGSEPRRRPAALRVASLGTREALHEQLRNFKFRDSLAYSQPLDLHLTNEAGTDERGPNPSFYMYEGTEAYGAEGHSSAGRGPSIDFSRLSVNSGFVASNRESVLSPASPTSSTRMSFEEEQLNAVARSGKDYEASSAKAPRRLTISRPSGTL